MWKLKSLREDLFEKGKLHAGMIVGTTLFPQMEIYGFIPRSPDFVCGISDFLSDVYMGYKAIGTDKIVYENNSKYGSKKMVSFPILRHIVCTSDVIKAPLMNVYVSEYISNEVYLNYRRAGKGENNKVSDIILGKLLTFSDQISKDDDDILYYTTRPNQLRFYRFKNVGVTSDSFSAVSDDFCVVCACQNPVSGSVEYRVYGPEDLILRCDENGDAGESA